MDRRAGICCPLWSSQGSVPLPWQGSMGGRARTCYLRFWRPPCNQLHLTHMRTWTGKRKAALIRVPGRAAAVRVRGRYSRHPSGLIDSLSARYSGRPKVCTVARPHSVNRCGMREADQNIAPSPSFGFAVCEPLSTVELRSSDGNNVFARRAVQRRRCRVHSRIWTRDVSASKALGFRA